MSIKNNVDLSGENAETKQMEDYALKFYGRRKGKPMRPGKAGAHEEVLPKIAIRDPASPFDAFGDGQPRKLWLEIGYGDGEHLAWQARQNPDIAMIGCEPFINGTAALCVQVREYDIRNIRIWPDDARLLMPHIPDQSIDRCFLLNSDPWPKTRHHKRRFIQPETLDELHRIMKPGAELRLSSDHAALTAWHLEKVCHYPGFEWTAESAAGWRQRPADLPETRYQKKGLTQGRPTIFLDFRRR